MLVKKDQVCTETSVNFTGMHALLALNEEEALAAFMSKRDTLLFREQVISFDSLPKNNLVFQRPGKRNILKTF